jgi:hypothetical protein
MIVSNGAKPAIPSVGAAWTELAPRLSDHAIVVAQSHLRQTFLVQLKVKGVDCLFLTSRLMASTMHTGGFPCCFGNTHLRGGRVHGGSSGADFG